jgi:hypothetical protein
MWLLPVGIVLTIVLLFHPAIKASSTNFTYTGFVNQVTKNHVATATINSTGAVSGKLDGGNRSLSHHA